MSQVEELGESKIWLSYLKCLINDPDRISTGVRRWNLFSGLAFGRNCLAFVTEMVNKSSDFCSQENTLGSIRSLLVYLPLGIHFALECEGIGSELCI